MHWKAITVLAGLSIFVVPTAIAAGKKYKVVEVKDGATISGQVTFQGEAPTIMLPVAKDAAVCHVTGNKGKPTPRLVVGDNGGVQNTVVFLTEVEEGKSFSEETPLLDQKDCVFTPHVLVVEQRKALKIKNSDSVLHNVHGYLGKADAFNLAMPNKDQVIEKKLRREGIISIKCDAGHSWMSAYVFVVEHPYYAVTDESGKFTLDNVPPGKYTVRVWHESWEDDGKDIELDVPVEVASGGTTELQFQLNAKGALTQAK